MRMRVFYGDLNGKICFSKEEIEKVLVEVYQEGCADGYKKGWDDGSAQQITIPTPYYPPDSGRPWWMNPNDPTYNVINCEVKGGDASVTARSDAENQN